MNNYPISVCLATYNGDLYLHAQIKSILDQLTSCDELIIVDDCSTDSTVEIILSFKDQRITNLIINKTNMGVNKSFEIAILQARNEFIYLADQDDIWVDGRVAEMNSYLACSDVSLVAGNSSYIDAKGIAIIYPVTPLKQSDSKKALKNIVDIFSGRSSYFGCAMAFKKDIVRTILPFPKYVESHDLWIAMACVLTGSIKHLENIVLLRRVHGNNVSLVSRPWLKKAWSRFVFMVSIVHIYIRLLSLKPRKEYAA